MLISDKKLIEKFFGQTKRIDKNKMWNIMLSLVLEVGIAYFHEEGSST